MSHDAEYERFTQLQRRLVPLFRDVFQDPRAPRTVVVVPGLSMDQEVISRIDGLPHYEERQLTMLMLLRLPNTRMVFVTSTPIDPVIIDYYLSLLPGVPHQQASRRLTLLSAYDGSAVTLTRKILDRPRLLQRIRAAIGDPRWAHLSCFNATVLERQLALALDIPLYGCDPALAWLGSKSGSRAVFRKVGIELAPGSEDLRDEQDIVAALLELHRENPALRRAVLKLNEGASGEGNAVFSFATAPATSDDGALRQWIRAHLRTALAFEAPGEYWDHYLHKFTEMRGIVEAWVDAPEVRSPSVQLRITPLGALEVISTHDQVLGGNTGQKFLGSMFPADPDYRLTIQTEALRVGAELLRHGVLGRFGVDFVVLRLPDGQWRCVAIEINLRKGGTTHTFQTLQFLTNGHYDPASGEFHMADGTTRSYYATDNLQSTGYRRLIPEDLIDIAVEQDLHFDQGSLTGVTFNMIGALSEYGKLGIVSIARDRQQARQQYERAVSILDTAAAQPGS